jgi:hypothetical protein
MADRRFDEKEVGALLKRAAELQAGVGDSGPDLPTLSQVQQAASELGIRPEFLEQAAAELSHRPPRTGIFDGSIRTRRSVTIPGRMTSDRWPMALDQMRVELGRVGTPGQVGEAFEWTTDGFHVSLVPDGPNTRVSIQSEITPALGLYLFLPLMLGIALISGIESALGLVAVILGVPCLALALIGGRYGISRVSGQRAAQIDQVIQIVESHAVLPVDLSHQFSETQSHVTLSN